MSNLTTFKSLYSAKLTEAVTDHPGNYSYTLEKVPEVAEKMVTAMLSGRAHIGPASRAVCKVLKIEPSAKSIQAYLTADTTPEPVTIDALIDASLAPMQKITETPPGFPPIDPFTGDEQPHYNP